MYIGLSHYLVKPLTIGELLALNDRNVQTLNKR